MAEEPRQPNGRFLPGNPGGPGGPQATTARKWAKLLSDNTTEEDFLAVWGQVVLAAKSGDTKAAILFFERLLGKPVQAVNVGDSEGGSLVFQIVTAKVEPKT